jgi:hypothetical protein
MPRIISITKLNFPAISGVYAELFKLIALCDDGSLWEQWHGRSVRDCTPWKLIEPPKYPEIEETCQTQTQPN